MAKKIYKQGAFLIVEDTVNGTLFELNSSDVQIKKENTNVDQYNIIDANGQSVLKVNLSEIVDANGDAYIENDWNTFRFEQVGAQNTTDVSTVKPKVYKALLTQTGTAAPTAVILENTLGDIVWTRDATGNYTATLYNAFQEGKAFFSTTPSAIMGYSVINIGWVSVNSLGFIVIDIETQTPIDEGVYQTPILIEVYP